MQNEIKARCEVPGAKGLIENPGFSRTEIMDYKRENIKAKWFRKKEWDYYLFTTEKFGIAFTISDLGYVGLLSVSFLDFEAKTEITDSEIVALPKGKKFNLGAKVKDVYGVCHTKRLDLEFIPKDGHRVIDCKFRNFGKKTDFTAKLDVYDPDMEAMYIATPWKEKPTAFYLNCKMNCLEAEGTVAIGDRTETVTRKECLGVLDWGRGVWTYDNTWFWGTGSGRLGDEPFGFNIGYGFSDRSSASENCIYYKGKIHKLSETDFGVPKKEDGKYDFMKPWNVTSDDGKFEGTFVPIIDRCAKMNFGVIVSDQHQVFGKMTGKCILESGEELSFNDFLCALEVVRNKY